MAPMGDVGLRPPNDVLTPVKCHYEKADQSIFVTP
jgi:hypothetical protein